MSGMSYRLPVSGQRGFTLAEMIVVIMITAIIGAVVAVFIRSPVQGYVDLVARAELVDEADTAVRRMSRDLRLALPNSIRISPDGALELLLTRTGGRYLDEEDGIANTVGDILDFSNPSDRTFTVVGASPPDCSQNCGDMVIYNLGQAPADAYCVTGGQCNRAPITSIDASDRLITLGANPFAQQIPRLRSPNHRFQIVSTPVTYACVGGVLTRYSNYAIRAEQTPSVPGNATTGVLANGVTSCAFAYDNNANIRNALIGITLVMERPNTHSGQITLFHQVHVDNTP